MLMSRDESWRRRVAIDEALSRVRTMAEEVDDLELVAVINAARARNASQMEDVQAEVYEEIAQRIQRHGLN